MRVRVVAVRVVGMRIVGVVAVRVVGVRIVGVQRRQRGRTIPIGLSTTTTDAVAGVVIVTTNFDAARFDFDRVASRIAIPTGQKAPWAKIAPEFDRVACWAAVPANQQRATMIPFPLKGFAVTIVSSRTHDDTIASPAP